MRFRAARAQRDLRRALVGKVRAMKIGIGKAPRTFADDEATAIGRDRKRTGGAYRQRGR